MNIRIKYVIAKKVCIESVIMIVHQLSMKKLEGIPWQKYSLKKLELPNPKNVYPPLPLDKKLKFESNKQASYSI